MGSWISKDAAVDAMLGVGFVSATASLATHLPNPELPVAMRLYAHCGAPAACASGSSQRTSPRVFAQQQALPRSLGSPPAYRDTPDRLLLGTFNVRSLAHRLACLQLEHTCGLASASQGLRSHGPVDEAVDNMWLHGESRGKSHR